MCIAAIGIVAGLAGGVMSAMGSLYSGQVQSAQYKAQAKMQQNEARSLAETGSFESWRKERENERLTGDQVVAIAAGGGDLSGTNLDVIRESRSEGDLDKALIRANMQQKSNMAMYQSAVSKMNAKAAKTGSMISAGAGLINSFQSVAGSFS